MFFCVFCILGNSNIALADSITYIVSTTKASVFAEPDLASTTLYTLSHKDEVEIELDGTSAKVYIGTGTSTEYNFFHITDSGYVLCDLLSIKSEQITQIPSFNAETNADSAVYEVNGSNFTKTDIILSKGTRIYLYEGYDDDLLMTAISYVLNDEVCYGYILTTTISPDGINSTVITCAIIVVALLGIIFAWLFIKNRQRKIKKEGKKALKEQKKQKKAEKRAKKQQKKLKNQKSDHVDEESLM